MQQPSISPTRGLGVHTRRGTCSNDPRQVAFSTIEKIVPLPSPSDSGPNSKDPQSPSYLVPINKATTDGVTHPRPFPNSFYRSRSNSMDIDQQNVEKTVYYFADSLADITRPEDYTFFGDEARAIMIFKWMRFYRYHPGLSKGIDKPRRDELKNHLNLPLSFGQRLGSFIINKFNTFRKWGLISTVDNGVIYHAATETWLSRTWDGNVEQTRQSASRDTRSPNSARTLLKRPAPSSTPGRDKRQRSTIVLDPNAPMLSSTFSDNSTVIQTPSLPPGPREVSVTSQISQASQDIEKTRGMCRLSPEGPEEDGVPIISSTVFINFIPRVTSTTVSGFSTISANPSLDSSPKNSVPDHHDLSARLEEMAANTAADGTRAVAQVTPWALPGRFQGDLVTLKHNERICRREVNESIEELEVVRNSHRHLLKEYENLKSEIQTSVLVLDMACKGSNATIPPTLAGTSEADFLKCLKEIRHKRDDTWLESKKAERIELEKKIAVQSEVMARKKVAVVERKAKHNELQTFIRDMKEKLAKDRRQKAKFEDFLSEFMDVEGGNSGTISPAESMSSDTEDMDDTEIEE